MDLCPRKDRVVLAPVLCSLSLLERPFPWTYLAYTFGLPKFARLEIRRGEEEVRVGSGGSENVSYTRSPAPRTKNRAPETLRPEPLTLTLDTQIPKCPHAMTYRTPKPP